MVTQPRDLVAFHVYRTLSDHRDPRSPIAYDPSFCTISWDRGVLATVAPPSLFVVISRLGAITQTTSIARTPRQHCPGHAGPPRQGCHRHWPAVHLARLQHRRLQVLIHSSGRLLKERDIAFSVMFINYLCSSVLLMSFLGVSLQFLNRKTNKHRAIAYMWLLFSWKYNQKTFNYSNSGAWRALARRMRTRMGLSTE